MPQNLRPSRLKLSEKEKSQLRNTSQSVSYILERLNDQKINNAVIVTTANYGYKDLVLNWIVSLLRTKHSKFVVFCLDSDLLVFLAERGYTKHLVLMPDEWLDMRVTTDAYTTGAEFLGIVQTKAVIWHRLAKLGFSFLFSDSDVVFLSEHVLANVQFSVNNSFAQVMFALARVMHRQKRYNTGFFYAMPTEFVTALFGELRVRCKQTTNQLALHPLLFTGMFNDKRHLVDNLDRFLYPSWNLFYERRMESLLHHVQPLTVHASGPIEKMRLLQSVGMWFLDKQGHEIFE